MYTTNQDTVTCERTWAKLSRREMATYRATHTSLNEQDDLLESCAGAEIDGGQPGDCHCADTVEERIDVADVKLAIDGEEDTREDEWGDGAKDPYECTETRGLLAEKTCKKTR
jgi:hypothetical protein